jgi:Ca-activated chloride channel family protein
MLALSFGHPWVLLALAVPVALLAWTWNRKGRRVVLPFDHGDSRRGTLLRVVLQGAESLPALGLAAVVLILAGPQRLDSPTTRRALTNIEFCVDISGSMTATFGEGTRYDAAMEAINGFLDYRTGDAFGLTFFGNNVLHWVPLTSDTSAFRCAPPFMDPKRGNNPRWFGGTAIGKALLACRDVLVAREEGDRMIILISDGISSDLSGGVDQEIAQRLRADGIQVYGVHVANTQIPAQVVNISTITGGQMFAPGDPTALDTVFRRIDEMQVTKLETVAAEFIDDFEVLSWIGIGILGLHLLVQFFLRYTPW